jgi:putative thioredoxin
MATDDIINVSEIDFEYEVLGYSQNTPVIVDFWAVWCRPCKTLSPMLEGLASEAHGSFRLAKVDVDGNPNLALRYGVHSLPTIKAFSQGEVVSELVGLIPEGRLREFVNRLAPPGPSSLAQEKADSLLNLRQWMQAEKTYREVLEVTPNQPAATLGLAKAILAQGRGQEALNMLKYFPPSRYYSQAEELMPYAKVLVDLLDDQLPEENELDASFNNSIRLAARGNLPAALDGLFDILRQAKRHNSGQTRLIVLSLLALLGDEDNLTRQYRTELASILF